MLSWRDNFNGCCRLLKQDHMLWIDQLDFSGTYAAGVRPGGASPASFCGGGAVVWLAREEVFRERAVTTTDVWDGLGNIGGCFGEQTGFDHADHDTVRWQRHQMVNQVITGGRRSGHLLISLW